MMLIDTILSLFITIQSAGGLISPTPVPTAAPTAAIQQASKPSSINKIYKSTTPQGNPRYDVQLDDEITQRLSDYSDVLQLLRSQSKDTVIVIHLAGYGGDKQNTQVLGNAIKNSKSIVIASVDGPVYSAHAYLALMVHYVHISADSGNFMIHRAQLNSDGDAGLYIRACKSPNFLKFAEAKKECADEDRFITKVVSGIFTKQELKRVLDGEDVTIDLSDLKARLEKAGRLVK